MSASKTPKQDEMHQKRDEIMREYKCDPGKAMQILRKRDPDLLEAAVDEANKLHNTRRQR